MTSSHRFFKIFVCFVPKLLNSCLNSRVFHVKSISVLTTIYLLLGSNLGDRQALMQSGITLIGERVGEIVQVSSLYETAPWGGIDQSAYLNQVVEVATDLAPEEVLRIILDIEHTQGRVRYERWGARHLDIDLLYYGTLQMDTARLTVPHPRLHERRFTLIPLVEIAPDFVHPIIQKTNISLLDLCTDDGKVSLYQA